MKQLKKLKSLKQIENQKPLKELSDRIKSFTSEIEELKPAQGELSMKLEFKKKDREELAVNVELSQANPEELVTLDKEISSLRSEVHSLSENIRVKELALQRLKTEYEEKKGQAEKKLSSQVMTLHAEMIDRQVAAFKEFRKASEELSEFEKNIPRGVSVGWMGLTFAEMRTRFQPKFPWWIDRATGRGYDL